MVMLTIKDRIRERSKLIIEAFVTAREKRLAHEAGVAFFEELKTFLQPGRETEVLESTREITYSQDIGFTVNGTAITPEAAETDFYQELKSFFWDIDDSLTREFSSEMGEYTIRYYNNTWFATVMLNAANRHEISFV